MCGIVGYVHPERPVPRETLQCMVDSLRHRGPDDQVYNSSHPPASDTVA